MQTDLQPSGSGVPRATILVAEDEQLIRDILGGILSSDGFRVIFAENGRQALQRIEEHGEAIDLLILDQVMPELTGLEVLKTLREAGNDVPVLLSSGYLRSEVEFGEALLAGLAPDEILEKPFEPPQLLRAVYRLLDRK